MTFPNTAFPSAALFLDAYAEQLAQALRSVSRDALERAHQMLVRAIAADHQIFSCGNGGSAAISNHLVCDHSKGICSDTALRPRVQSLSANMELLTALSNDLDYSQVFCRQLAYFARPGDVLITISSSGDSPNVVEAIRWARANDVGTIALSGFQGGRTAAEADVSLHVDADNYGIIEDVHQSLMHVLAQFIRQSHMPADLIAQRKF